ncbi:hypothetical protein ViNHUV68_22300 [Vibrio sp. NH-UV-68]
MVSQIGLNRKDSLGILRDIRSEIYPNSVGYFSAELIQDQERA